MLIVPGITLKSLNPRFWDGDSEYYLPDVKALMVSYADFHALPSQRKRAMDEGIHRFLGIKHKRVQVFLDNGAFHALSRNWRIKEDEYIEFVQEAKPDWYPIPKDFIPTPSMPRDKQRRYFQKTMQMNLEYKHDAFVPIIHVGRYLDSYLESVEQDGRLSKKPEFGLGGLVPNLLRTPNAPSHDQILASLIKVRTAFGDKRIHVFGIGGVSTLHLAALLRLDSLDSSGWRNRASRGIIQLPGKGDRMVAKLGSWNIRKLSLAEVRAAEECECPACGRCGLTGLKEKSTRGFRNRAIHNLYVLMQEDNIIANHLRQGTYSKWYKTHLSNSTYRPLIDKIIEQQISLDDKH